MIKFMQQPLDLYRCDVGRRMAWVFDSIDRDLMTYKDFISILKMYTYRHSSLAYMFVYILVTFTFGYYKVVFAKIIRTAHLGSMSLTITEGMIQQGRKS